MRTGFFHHHSEQLTGQALAVLTAVEHKGGFPVQRGSAPPVRGWGTLGGQAADSEGRGSGSEGSGSKVKNALSWHKCQHRFKGVGGNGFGGRAARMRVWPALGPGVPGKREHGPGKQCRRERTALREVARLVLDLEIQRHPGGGPGWSRPLPVVTMKAGSETREKISSGLRSGGRGCGGEERRPVSGLWGGLGLRACACSWGADSRPSPVLATAVRVSLRLPL